MIHGPETLEGGSILQEWGNEFGVELWQAFRDVMLWATTEEERRAELFSSGQRPLPNVRVERQARLASALSIVEEMVRAPAAAREESVAGACRAISEWAQSQDKLHTALAFAQNAALAGRTDPGAAFWVATLAGRLNDHARAEGWFRRAVGLARQSHDWRMYSRSFSGLGNLYIRRGNLPAARRLHTRALRGARRGGMRREQAYALHDLFVVAVELGNAREAEKFARQALDASGVRNDRVHALAHDVAYYWMEQGYFARALPVFQATLPLIGNPRERAFVLANVVRAAGGAADARLALSTADEVERLLADPRLGSATAGALLEVGRGLHSLGEFERAEQVARKALRSANDLRENKVSFAIEALLDSITDASRRSIAVAEELQPTAWGSADELAADFVRTLETIAGAA